MSAPIAATPDAPTVALWPREHGATCLLGTGLLLAALAAGGPGAAWTFATFTALAGFLAGHAWANDAPGVRRMALALATSAGAAGAAAAGAPADAALAGLAASGLGAAAFRCARLGGPANPAGLSLGAAAIGAVAAGATAAGGAPRALALLAGAAVLVYAASRLFAVRGLLAGHGGRALAAAAVPPLIGAIGAAGGLVPALLAGAMLPGLLVTSVLVRRRSRPTAAHIGRHELVAALAFAFLAGHALRSAQSLSQ